MLADAHSRNSVQRIRLPDIDAPSAGILVRARTFTKIEAFRRATAVARLSALRCILCVQAVNMPNFVTANEYIRPIRLHVRRNAYIRGMAKHRALRNTAADSVKHAVRIGAEQGAPQRVVVRDNAAAYALYKYLARGRRICKRLRWLHAIRHACARRGATIFARSRAYASIGASTQMRVSNSYAERLLRIMLRGVPRYTALAVHAYTSDDYAFLQTILRCYKRPLSILHNCALLSRKLGIHWYKAILITFLASFNAMQRISADLRCRRIGEATPRAIRGLHAVTSRARIFRFQRDSEREYAVRDLAIPALWHNTYSTAYTLNGYSDTLRGAATSIYCCSAERVHYHVPSQTFVVWQN